MGFPDVGWELQGMKGMKEAAIEPFECIMTRLSVPESKL
jgi:hypothetical protein